MKINEICDVDFAVRPKPPVGSDTPDIIFHAVGMALHNWETLESELGEIFDTIVSGSSSSRMGFAAYSAITQSSARTDVIKATTTRYETDAKVFKGLERLISLVEKFGARRNEFAHGRVYNLGKHKFYLAPNNITPRKWKLGAENFQYNHEDVEFYAERFDKLADSAKELNGIIKGTS